MNRTHVLPGMPIAEDTAVIQAGLDVNISEAATLGISYNGEFRKEAMTNGIDAKLNVRF